MKKTVLFFVVLITLISISNIYSQGIPQTINYQGVLKDVAGVVVPNGDYSLTFKLYDLPSGGSALWNETKTINVVGGIINTQLGSVTPITSATIVGAAWLGITVGTGSELIPRITLTSVPYSIMSLTVPSGSITATKIADAQVVKSLNGLKDNVNLVAGSNVTITPNGNNITINATGSGGGGTVTQVNTGSGLTGGPITSTGTLSISNDGITTSMLQNNSVTSGKITDGTIATTDLSDNSVTSAKIVDGTISATDIGTTQVVKSINTIKDNVTLVAGSNVTITPSGNNITIASTSGGTIGGSGTANYISKFTSSTTLGSSTLFDDGNRIGLGTNTPDFSLTVNTTPTLGLGLKVSRTGGGLIGLAIVEEGQPTSLRGWSLESWNQKLRINASGALVTDYYFPNAGIKWGNFNNYDDPEGAGAHIIETGLLLRGPDSFPLSLSGFINVYNDAGSNTYFQIDYPTTVAEVPLNFFVGASTGSEENPGYYGTETFNVINVGVKAVKSVKITEDYSLPVSVTFIVNPRAEISYLVFGLTF